MDAKQNATDGIRMQPNATDRSDAKQDAATLGDFLDVVHSMILHHEAGLAIQWLQHLKRSGASSFRVECTRSEATEELKSFQKAYLSSPGAASSIRRLQERHREQQNSSAVPARLQECMPRPPEASARRPLGHRRRCPPLQVVHLPWQSSSRLSSSTQPPLEPSSIALPSTATPAELRWSRPLVCSVSSYSVESDKGPPYAPVSTMVLDESSSPSASASTTVPDMQSRLGAAIDRYYRQQEINFSEHWVAELSRKVQKSESKWAVDRNGKKRALLYEEGGDVVIDCQTCEVPFPEEFPLRLFKEV